MRKFQPYLQKKVYLDEQIFSNMDTEIKIGYLNINGLNDGNHINYLNADHNLLNLDILVLSETKLGKSDMAEEVKKNLDRWSARTIRLRGWT